MKRDYKISKTAYAAYIVYNTATKQSLYKGAFYKGNCADVFDPGTTLNVLEFSDGCQIQAILMDFSQIAENGQRLNNPEAFVQHYRYLGYHYIKHYTLVCN